MPAAPTSFPALSISIKSNARTTSASTNFRQPAKTRASAHPLPTKLVPCYKIVNACPTELIFPQTPARAPKPHPRVIPAIPPPAILPHPLLRAGPQLLRRLRAHRHPRRSRFLSFAGEFRDAHAVILAVRPRFAPNSARPQNQRDDRVA